MMSQRIYIRFLVYDYDHSNRYRTIEHNCKTTKQARHLIHRFEQLGKGNNSYAYERSGNWLDRKHGIHGFIERIDGIYEEITRRIE